MKRAHKSVDAVEALRRGQSQSRSLAEARLDTALSQGRGHVVVTGDSQHETEVFVAEVLRGVVGYRVEHVFAGAALSGILDEPTIVVVHGAEKAGADALENFRMSVEQDVGALERIRVLLVGTPALERTLAEPQARALASRVGAIVRLPSQKPRFRKAPAQRRRRKLLPSPLVGSATLATAALVLTWFTDLPPEREAGRYIAAALQYVIPLAEEAGALLADGASFGTTGESGTSAAGRPERRPPGAPVRVTRSAAVGVSSASAATQHAPSAADVDSAAARPLIAAGGAGYSSQAVRAAAASGSTGTPTPRQAPFFSVVRSGSWAGSTGAPVGRGAAYAAATLPPSQLRSSGFRLTADERRGRRASGTRGAVLETLLMSQELDRNPSYRARKPAVQAGAYEDAGSAFALKTVLTGLFDLLAVARTEPDATPVYSVRVFDVDTDQELRNVEHLMTSGDEVPVEIFN